MEGYEESNRNRKGILEAAEAFAQAASNRALTFMDALSGRLMSSAEDARDSHLVGRRLALAREVRESSAALYSKFHNHLLERCRFHPSAGGSAAAAGSAEAGGLQVMDYADTEREVSIRKVVSGMRNTMPHLLEALDRFAKTQSDLRDQNPQEIIWHPRVVAEGFLQALDHFPFSDEDKIFLMHWFDQMAARAMQPDYEALIDHLNTLGFGIRVNPWEADASGYREGAGAPVSPSSEPETVSDPGPDDGASRTESGPEAFSGREPGAGAGGKGHAVPGGTWAAFGLNGSGPSPRPPGGGGAPGNGSPFGGGWADFGFAVPGDGAQAGAMPGGGPMVTGVPWSVFEAMLRGKGSASREEPERGKIEPFVMDLLQGLFDLILKRDDLNPVFRSSLADLQYPVARVAMADTAFFRDRRHPARETVGMLMNAALRIDPDLDEETVRAVPLSHLVIETVDRIRSEGGEDVETWRGWLERLKSDMEGAETTVDQSVKPDMHTARHEERVAAIASRIEETIRGTIVEDAAGLTEETQDQFVSTWVPLLTAHQADSIQDAEEDSGEVSDPDEPVSGNANDEDGHDGGIEPVPGAEPEGVGLLRDLIRIVQETPESQLSSPILARVRSYLEGAPLTEEERATIRGDLVDIHLAASRASPEREQKPRKSPREANKARRERSRIPNRFKATEESRFSFGHSPRHPDDDPSLMQDRVDEYLHQVDRIEIGTWIQFTSPAGTRVERMKLLWRGTHAGRILFSDAGGQKRRQHSVQGLAHEFRCGRARVIPNESVFDHLMEQAMTA